MAEFNTLRRVLEFMQRNDNNGEYYTYLDDFQAGAMSINDIINDILPILQRWRNDIGFSKAPAALAILRLEYDLLMICDS